MRAIGFGFCANARTIARGAGRGSMFFAQFLSRLGSYFKDFTDMNDMAGEVMELTEVRICFIVTFGRLNIVQAVVSMFVAFI